MKNNRGLEKNHHGNQKFPPEIFKQNLHNFAISLVNKND